MKLWHLALLGCPLVLLSLLPWLTGTRSASGQVPVQIDGFSRIDNTLQGISSQLKDLDHSIRHLSVEQQVKDGGILTAGTQDTWRWAMNPNGKVLRIDQRDGSAKVVFEGRPGRWTLVATYASYCWMFSAGGHVLRVDIRDGEMKQVLSTQPGVWDVVAGQGAEKTFAVVVNRDSEEVVRLDRRNGDTQVLMKPKPYFGVPPLSKQ